MELSGHSRARLKSGSYFRPVPKLTSGARIEVDRPKALVFRAGLAVYINPNGIPTFFHRHDVCRLISANGKAGRAS
jgi:hypothetical protein